VLSFHSDEALLTLFVMLFVAVSLASAVIVPWTILRAFASTELIVSCNVKTHNVFFIVFKLFDL